MAIDRLTGSLFVKMIRSAANNLENKKSEVNALNVFPVPDGDTGTNMGLTLLAAAKEAEAVQEDKLSIVAEAAARGSLMGARGNSGVILSQFFRGIWLGLEKLHSAGPREVAEAIKRSSDTAYKAVIKPVEGTMLTVGRYAAEAALAATRKNTDVLGVLEAALVGAKEGLEKTPTMLAVLREAGVVDAGGYGMVVALEGALHALKHGAPIHLVETPQGETRRKIEPRPERVGIVTKEDIEFKYCTEFLVRGKGLDTDSLRESLAPLGDSLLVVGNGETVKVHVHTNTPGEALNICGALGDLLEININNMVEQNRQAAGQVQPEKKSNQPQKDLAVVAVCAGQGLSQIFSSMGADVVVMGGQTMNPSTEDLVNAVKQTNAQHVLLLPNNKNILFTAEQVKHLVNQKVHVVPTKTIPQGIGALMAFTPGRDPEQLSKDMHQAARSVKTGEITFAVRSTTAGGLQIQEQDIIGLNEGEIKAAGKDMEEVAVNLVKAMVDENSEIITIYYGEEMSEAKANRIRELLAEQFPDCEVEVYYGGQPLYYYLVGVE